MEITHRIEDGVCILSIRGNISLEKVEVLKTYAQPFLTDETVHAILINCSRVKFIDSLGISALVYLLKAMKKRRAKLLLCHVSVKNQKLFFITRLDKILKVYPTETEALFALSE